MQGHHFGVIGDASGTVGKVSTGRPRSLDIPSDARQPKLYSSLNSELPKVVEILERVQVLPCSPLPLPSPEDRGFKRFSSFVRVCNSVVGVFVGIFIQTLQWLSRGRIWANGPPIQLTLVIFNRISRLRAQRPCISGRACWMHQSVHVLDFSVVLSAP